MTRHWILRVNERIGNVSPKLLWDGLIWAIQNDRTDLVEYMGRHTTCGRRAFKFRTPDGRFFAAIIDTEDMIPLTVLPEGFTVKVGRNRRVLTVGVGE